MNEVTIENVTPPNELEHGTFWQHNDGEVYILCRVAPDRYCLVDLVDGERWLEPRPRIDEVFSDRRDEFTQITSGKIIITPKP